MRKSIIAGAAVTASLALAGTAQANTVMTDFDDFSLGSVNNQHGWTVGAKYDTEIMNMGGGNSFRASNAVTDGGFADMPYSAPVDPAGEQEVNDTLVQSFDFHSADPQQMQQGLSMSISPTGEGGSRMNYVRLEDRYDGIRVFWMDGTFTPKWIATLDRTQNHDIRFVTKFVPGNGNDIAAVYVDGSQRVCGTSWEDYYRLDEQREPAVTDRLMWRLSGTAAPDLEGRGFIFDNVAANSYSDDQDYTCAAPLPQGPAGEDGEDGANGTNGTNGTNGKDGKNGANGANGVTTISHDNGAGALIGNTMRTLHVKRIKGEKFVSARATLRNKRLPVHGRAIKVDLRDRNVGNYNVYVTAKYRTKSGKKHTVRFMRALSVSRSN
jgi:hypothetical protein